jgi:hypothetical protein
MYYDNPWYLELWRTWLDMFRDGPLGIAFGSLAGLIVLAVVLFVLYGIFRALDHQEGPGLIADTWIREGYWGSESYTEYGMHWENGKYVFGPYTASRPKWVPPQPMVRVALIDGGEAEEFAVDGGEYAAAAKDSPVRITFQRGRFSGATYILSYARA